MLFRSARRGNIPLKSLRPYTNVAPTVACKKRRTGDRLATLSALKRPQGDVGEPRRPCSFSTADLTPRCKMKYRGGIEEENLPYQEKISFALETLAWLTLQSFRLFLDQVKARQLKFCGPRR